MTKYIKILIICVLFSSASFIYSQNIENVEPSDSNLIQMPFKLVKDGLQTGAVTNIVMDSVRKYDNSLSYSSIIDSKLPLVGGGGTDFRGIGNALVVVDGVPKSVDFNLEEVESITVLRDASACLLYGSQARNGVILVTTKRGSKNKQYIKFNADYGISTPIETPKYVNASDYMKLYNEARINDGLETKYSQSYIDSTIAGNNPYKYPDVEYYSNKFYSDYKPTLNVNGEFSGGNKRTRYFLNLGYKRSRDYLTLGQGGDSYDNEFKVRANLDMDVTDFLTASVDVVTNMSFDKGIRGCNYWNKTNSIHPSDYSPLLPIDLIISTDQGVVDQAFNSNKVYENKYLLGANTSNTSDYDNLYGDLFYNGYGRTTTRDYLVNTSLDFDLKKILKGLKAKICFSYNTSNSYYEEEADAYQVYLPTWTANDSIHVEAVGSNDKNTQVSNVSNPIIEKKIALYGVLSYNKQINKGNTLNINAIGYVDNTRHVTTNSSLYDDKNSHLAVDVDYYYKEKYLVKLSSAFVHSIFLPSSKPLVVSPSVGLGWVISKENFLKDNDFVNYLKLRASFSDLKNDNTYSSKNYYNLFEDAYSLNGSYTWGIDGNASSSKVSIVRNASENLKLEERKEFNLGITGSFFNDFWSVDLDYYNINLDNLLTEDLIPSTLGGLNSWTNYNSEIYQGLEISSHFKKQINKFYFDFGTQFSWNKSKYNKLKEEHDYSYQYKEGQVTDALYGYTCEGFYTSDDFDSDGNVKEGLAIPTLGLTAQPGDLKYTDINNDGVINSDDKKKIGHTRPSYSYSLQLLMKYKRFSFFANGHGIADCNTCFNGDYWKNDGDDKYTVIAKERWTSDMSSDAEYPRLTSYKDNHNYNASTFWMVKKDYFKIDRIQLSYDLPVKLTDFLKIKGASVYVKASNLLTISSYSDELNMKVGSSPASRSFSFGIRTTF